LTVEIVEILRNSQLFKGTKEKELNEIAAFGALRSCSRGEFVFREGDTGEEFYIIVEGQIAIYKNLAGGRRRIVTNLGTGEVFGEITLFDAEPHSADAQATENTRILVISNRKFRELIRNNLVLAFIVQTRIIRVLCKRLRVTDELLKEGVLWSFGMET
jgi:CRP-like cAMP-binding protein